MSPADSTTVQFNVTPTIISGTPSDGRIRQYVECAYTDSQNNPVSMPLIIPKGDANQLALKYTPTSTGPNLQLLGAVSGTQGTNAVVSPNWTLADNNQVTIPAPGTLTDVILVFASTTAPALLYASSDPQIQNDNA